MQFSKYVCALKEVKKGFSLRNKPLGGICRIETEDNVSTLFISLVNLSVKHEGKYHLYILCDSGEFFTFDLGIKPSSFTTPLPCNVSFSNGFAAGICFETSSSTTLIAFSKLDESKISIEGFKSKVLSSFIKELEYESPNLQNATKEYDDEAVATENYFSFEKTEETKKEPVEYEKLQYENGVPNSSSQEKKEESQEDFIGRKDEENTSVEQAFNEQSPYYQSARKELEQLFEKFADYPDLKTYFPDSKFVKIPYSAQKFYIVGVIKENKQEKYICYGVPEKYSEKAPKELEGYCTFIPLSVFDLKGDGFWMMFQDAVTGECVKKN